MAKVAVKSRAKSGRVTLRMAPPSRIGPACARAARRSAPVASLLSLAACQPAVLDPQGPVGIAQKTLLIDSLAIMLAIVLPTIAATLAFAWWFRASNPKARRRPDFVYSGRLEMLVWSVPLLTIMLLGGVAWIGSHDLDPGKPLQADGKPLEVQVVSLDWKWLFIYPEQRIASVNRLVLPAAVPVHFTLTSASVMNTFFVPQLGSMIYTMNGMASELHLQANQPGTFHGLSGHFSGDGFSDMQFDTEAMPADRFAAWAEDTRKEGGTLDAASYAKLAVQGLSDPFTFREVDPELFRKIVTQAVPPGPGPSDSGGGQAGQAARTPEGVTRTADAAPVICSIADTVREKR